LSILFKGKSIGEMLAMSVEDAREFFAAQRSVHHPVSLLADVGLGYLSLGSRAQRCRAAKASASNWSPNSRRCAPMRRRGYRAPRTAAHPVRAR
jgi:excinuclease ABC subunit A